MTQGLGYTGPYKTPRKIRVLLCCEVTDMCLILLSAGRGGKGLPSHASSMDPGQEHHIHEMLMGCCSLHSSVLKSLLPYILGCAQSDGRMPPHNRAA